MTDIIANAKQLLDGATTAPWEWVGYSLESEHGMVLDFQCVTAFGQSGALREVEVTPEDEVLIAAAPELAQALAEEAWEYAVAFKSTNGLGYLDRSGKPQPWPLLAAWYLTKEIAQVALMNSEYRKETLCIVRRRVSPVEVIDE